MREVEFEHWLGTRTELSPLAQSDARSRCRRVEKFEGDLDRHFTDDRMATLLARLKYTSKDEEINASARHSIPMEGGANIRNGTASFANAIRKYLQFSLDFSVSMSSSRPLERVPKISNSNVRSALGSAAWPEWSTPCEDDLLTLAHITVPYIRFLSPEIVEAIVHDNDAQRTNWENRLSERNVNPALYLWEHSSCTFPGVRRHSGSEEIAHHRRLKKLGNLPHALKIDDNYYPKSLWSFSLRGKAFQNQGPKDYALAHLADHKAYKNRGQEEFTNSETSDNRLALFGLFTCASNMVYLPTGLIRPTDFNFTLRNLIQRQAFKLYGSFCNLLPPTMNIHDTLSENWALDTFHWSSPVGDLTHIEAFLRYRSNELEKIFSD